MRYETVLLCLYGVFRPIEQRETTKTIDSFFLVAMPFFALLLEIYLTFF